jgi:hypothetical protein
MAGIQINWRKVWSNTLEVFEFSAYFLLTIVLFSSLGVWFPFANDWASSHDFSVKTLNDLPWNLITYAIAIVMVSFIDRLLHLFKVSNKYKRNEREFLLLLIVLCLGAWLIYNALVNSRFNNNHDAIFYSLLFTCLAWIVWIYVKLRTPRYGNFSSLGGEMT